MLAVRRLFGCQRHLLVLFPGVAQLVARVVWDHEAAPRSGRLGLRALRKRFGESFLARKIFAARQKLGTGGQAARLSGFISGCSAVGSARGLGP